MDRFRKEYTPLKDGQKSLGLRIKEKAEELAALYEEAEIRSAMTDASHPDALPYLDDRCMGVAMTELESSVMWAVKGVYTGTRDPGVA